MISGLAQVNSLNSRSEIFRRFLNYVQVATSETRSKVKIVPHTV